MFIDETAVTTKMTRAYTRVNGTLYKLAPVVAQAPTTEGENAAQPVAQPSLLVAACGISADLDDEPSTMDRDTGNDEPSEDELGRAIHSEIIFAEIEHEEREARREAFWLAWEDVGALLSAPPVAAQHFAPPPA